MSTPEAKNSVLTRVFPITEGSTFTSEEYLRASTGPFAAKFRAMVPDVESRNKLDVDRLKEDWASEMRRVGDHFGFDAEQQAKAAERLKGLETQADLYFSDLETKKKIKKYYDDLAEIVAIDRNPDALSYERERAIDTRKTAETDRKALVKPILDWEKELSLGWVGLATKEQVERVGEYAPPLDELDKIDRMTMYGTTAVGICLMLGLFTPLAGLAGAAFLALIYLSMPPFPGLPVSPKSEGHYVYVNKNVVEFFAMLVIASTPSGLWFGIDAFLFGWINRIGRRADLDQEEGADLSDMAVSKSRKPKYR